MKKSISVFALSILSFTCLAQSNEAFSNNPSSVLSAANGMKSSYGSMLSYYNPPVPIDGSVYLFDKWNNAGEIYTVDNRKLIMNNINLNVKRNVFESRIVEDSLYVFNFNNIDRFEVNGKTFKNYFWDGDNRVYQVLAEHPDFSILKGFKISIIQSSPNPMVNRSNDKYVLKESYYLKANGVIDYFRLNQRQILKLIEPTKEQRAKILEYVEKLDLSFRNEDDINKIVSYGMQLKQ